MNGLDLNQFMRMIVHKGYRLPNIVMTDEEKKDINYRKMEDTNYMLGDSFYTIFNQYITEQGRIPTPTEFINKQYKDVERDLQDEGFRARQKVTFKLTNTVKKGICQRILRSYVSFVNELHTELVIKELFPTCKILRGDELDFKGVDILAVVDGVDLPIHVTSNTGYGIDYLLKKCNAEVEFRKVRNQLYSRPRKKELPHYYYQERESKGHVFLLYTRENTYSTEIVNGYPLFRNEYIQDKLNTRLELQRVK